MNAEQWSTIRDIRNWAFLEGRESWGKHINLLIDENAALTAERATLAQQLQQAQAQLAAVPVEEINRVYAAAEMDGYSNQVVAVWLDELDQQGEAV